MNVLDGQPMPENAPREVQEALALLEHMFNEIESRQGNVTSLTGSG